MAGQSRVLDAFTTAAGPTSLGAERRCFPRLRCSGTAEVYLSPLHSCRCARLLNLSERGCRLELAEPCELSPGVAVEVAFIVNQLPFRVRAEVRTVTARKTVGMSFLNLSVRSTLNLQELVQELIDRQQPLA